MTRFVLNLSIELPFKIEWKLKKFSIELPFMIEWKLKIFLVYRKEKSEGTLHNSDNSVDYHCNVVWLILSEIWQGYILKIFLEMHIPMLSIDCFNTLFITRIFAFESHVKRCCSWIYFFICDIKIIRTKINTIPFFRSYLTYLNTLHE